MTQEMIVSEALVNKRTGEVIEIGLQKTPEEIMLDAKTAAEALENLIKCNKRPPMEFNGKRHLEFPHWQTVAKFYHATVTTQDAEYLEIGGVKGFKAKAVVIDEKNGTIIGGAEAYCMADEGNWRSKPLYQLASMAQTRAACKALSNKYRYVAIVAGYEPTAAEEMDSSPERTIQPPREKTVATGPDTSSENSTKPNPEKLISEKQRAMLYARWHAADIPDELARLFLKENFGLEHTSEMTRGQLDKMLKWIDSQNAAPE